MKGIALVLSVAAVVFGSSCVSGCGRYKAPLAPEMFAPKAVDALTVTCSESGVLLAWAAPDEDRRGKELKTIDGYAIQRKMIAQKGDETDPRVRFETIGFVRDQHVMVRENLRKEARAEGKIGRTIESPEQYTKFTFVDTTAAPSTTYMYQVVPRNQGGADGAVSQVARVTFKGSSSDIAMVPVTEVAEMDTSLNDRGALS
ncbi:MAG: hypothetical protein RIS36_2096 [Pseudomonadota bacterium]|jgi:hypothetical protein